MLLALETSQIAAAVAVLVLAALIVALLARALVSRRARPAADEGTIFASFLTALNPNAF